MRTLCPQEAPRPGVKTDLKTDKDKKIISAVNSASGRRPTLEGFHVKVTSDLVIPVSVLLSGVDILRLLPHRLGFPGRARNHSSQTTPQDVTRIRITS